MEFKELENSAFAVGSLNEEKVELKNEPCPILENHPGIAPYDID